MAKQNKPRKPGSGGKRPGAGRKPKGPTCTISFRIPVQHRDWVKEAVRRVIADLG